RPLFRYGSARGPVEVAGPPHQRSEDTPVAQDVAQGASGGTDHGRRVAVQWGETVDAWDSPGWGDFADDRERLHESLSEGLSPAGPGPALRGATRQLRGRLRGPVSVWGGGGARAEPSVVRPHGVDAQRAEDPGVRWAARGVYLSGLHLWADAVSEGWPWVLGRRASQEGGETGQGTHPGDPPSG